jgi:hypothetical protein
MQKMQKIENIKLIISDKQFLFRDGNSLERFGPRGDRPNWEWLSSLTMVIVHNSTARWQAKT